MGIPKPLTLPWAISEQGMQLVLAIWSRDEFFADVRARAVAVQDGAPLENGRSATTVRDGVATIPIRGPLFRHASMLTAVSGATSYSAIAEDLRLALEDPSVQAILFDVDSPGGEANGCDELGEAIYAARQRKLTGTYIGGTGASAAWWTGSATEFRWCGDTAMVGSIGVLQPMVDSAGAEEKAGIRVLEIVSSQSPAKRSLPVDDAVIARVTAHLNELCGIFIERVARNCGVSPEIVAADFGCGDVVIGRRALEVGMVHGISNFEAAHAELAARAKEPRVFPPPATRPDTNGEEAMLTANANAKPKAKAAAAGEAPEDKKDKPGDVEMAKCMECDDGKLPDGTKCETCGGTGKVAKAADEVDEPPAAEGHAPDGDETGHDGDKQAEARALAQLGLGPNASRREIMLALSAGAAVPMAKVGDMVRKQVRAALDAEKATAAKVDAGAKAADLGLVYASYGADKDEVDAIVALAKGNYKAAETIVKGHPGAKLAGRLTVGGAPVNGRQRGPVAVATSNAFNVTFAARAQELLDSKDAVALAKIERKAGKNATAGMRLAAAQQIVAEEEPHLLEDSAE